MNVALEHRLVRFERGSQRALLLGLSNRRRGCFAFEPKPPAQRPSVDGHSEKPIQSLPALNRLTTPCVSASLYGPKVF